MPGRRASPTDRQSFLYTKVPDLMYDLIARRAKLKGRSVYKEVRSLIYSGLAADCQAYPVALLRTMQRRAAAPEAGKEGSA